MKVHTVCNEAMRDLLQHHGHSFVGYLTAGYPDEESFLRIVRNCEERGLHIFEIGYPSQNPYLDGEVIRNAHAAVHSDLRTDLKFWKRLRDTISAPIWLMGYTEDLIDSGMYRKLAELGYIDALVIPDMDHERRIALKKEMEPQGVEVLGFTCHSNDVQQIRESLEVYSLIYQQLYSGPTGIQNTSEDYLELLTESRKESNARLFAGFGIGTPERANELLHHGFDGVIIGTAIMKQLNQSEEDLYQFVGRLAETVEGVK